MIKSLSSGRNALLHYLTAKNTKNANGTVHVFFRVFSRLSRLSLLKSFNYQHLSPLASDSRLNSFNYQQLTPLASDSRPNSFNYQHLSPLARDSRLNSFNYQHLSPLARDSRQESSITHCSLLISHWAAALPPFRVFSRLSRFSSS
jgi:hypothetical protein